MPDPEVQAAPTDRAVYCPLCLADCQNGYPPPPMIVGTAGTSPISCPGWKRRPTCTGHVPVPAT